MRRAHPFARAIWIGSLALAIGGCATLSGERIVYVDVGGDNRCLVTIGARGYALPDEVAVLARRLRGLAGPRSSALMSPRPALTSPGCWDEAMALVRAAGFRRIGFFSEEPEPGAERIG